MAQASGTYSHDCPGAPANNVPFIGPNASPGTCILDFPVVGNTPGTATPKIENTMSGLDFFTVGIGMVYDTSSLDQGQFATYTFSVSTSPTWDKNPVPTFLGLNGSVQIPDQFGTLSIDLIGMLGGPVQVISVDLNHDNCVQCTLAIPFFSSQAPALVATETITLMSVGRVVYRTGTDVFSGSVPEPGTMALVFSALCSMIGVGTKPGIPRKSA